jgi:hypothetical protein
MTSKHPAARQPGEGVLGTRKTQLEHHIRKSAQTIYQAESSLQASKDPKERARSRRAIKEQKQFVGERLQEYALLCERLGLPLSDDIAFIAASLLPREESIRAINSSLSESSVHPTKEQSVTYLSETGRPQVGRAEAEDSPIDPMLPSINELAGALRRYLLGVFSLTLLFLIGLLEGIVGIFDITPCSRRLMLAILTLLAGGALLILSSLPRYRHTYRNRDRWLTLVLFILTVAVLTWFAYRTCR